ncbi:MAG: SPFH domain-containing protein [Caldilineaceae bacterium]|nr:SPFH domain-containing protein [Caldilineaceae bacterium]
MARIIDVVEAPDQGQDELVVCKPEYGSGDFRMGSQVIVRESQRAVFYRDGRSLDTFEPGRHTITTANLPILSTLMRFGTGGNNVFTAEVYFVNMREFTDQKWGTPEPISLRDTDLGLVRLRGFGQYTMQVADPKRFVDQFVGTQGMYRTAQISDYLRSVIISKITDLLAENMTSILDLPRLFNELSAAMRASLQDDFLAMGIALKQFRIVSISPTEETAKAIDERASMGAIGDMNAYMQFKAARAIGDAAQQPGGGSSEGLGLGAGIGMGAGMAGMLTNAFNTAQQQPQQQQPAASAGAAASVPDVMTLEEAAAYLKVSADDVQALIDEGQIAARKIGSQYRISKGVIDQFMAG